MVTSAEVLQVSHDGQRFEVRLADGEPLSADRLLVATGRRVDLTDLGVDTVGLDPEARSLTVDEHLRAAEGIWAVGDVTGHGAFTHIGTYQATIAVRDILGQAGPGAEYDAVPRVTFTDPEIGGVGLTQAQAQERGLSVRTGLAQVPSSARGWIHKAGNEGLIKLVVDDSHRPARGSNRSRPLRWRGARRPRGRGTRPGARRPAAAHDLRLPHLPPRHRGRVARPR